MKTEAERLTTRCCGGADLGKMTRSQALRFARKTMDAGLKRAGFVPVIVRTTLEINGWEGYRIAYTLQKGAA